MGFSPHYGGIRGNAGGHSPVGGDSLLVTQAGGGSCTRRGELKFRRKEEDYGKRGQREGMGRSQPTESLAFPKSKVYSTGGTSLEGGTRFPACWSWGALAASHPCVVPTHHLAWALLVGDLLRAPEVDANFACLTSQTLLGVSWEECAVNKRDWAKEAAPKARSRGGRLGHGTEEGELGILMATSESHAYPSYSQGTEA